MDNSSHPQQVSALKKVEGINCLTAEKESLVIENGCISQVSRLENTRMATPYLGPGLIDMQVNGIQGIDFNDTRLSAEDMLAATRHLLSQGVTTFFPTVITNSDQNVHTILQTMDQACRKHALVARCVGGIHLEGPFISEVEGARGAHDRQYIKAPDWLWVQTCQKRSGGRIKLITLSPEWEGIIAFIQQCRQHGIWVAIGHTQATPEQIRIAVDAGATLSTHLGNAVALMLPRHPNLLWEQLAQDGLYASLIADGFHLPDAFLKVAIRTKRDRAMLVSDATRFSGQPAGIYQTHIGDEVVLDKDGRLCMKKNPELLAGATKGLLEDVQYLIDRKLASLSDAWKMASVHPARFLGDKDYGLSPAQPADVVVFQMEQEKIQITQVIKQGQIVFEP